MLIRIRCIFVSMMRRDCSSLCALYAFCTGRFNLCIWCVYTSEPAFHYFNVFKRSHLFTCSNFISILENHLSQVGFFIHFGYFVGTVCYAWLEFYKKKTFQKLLRVAYTAEIFLPTQKPSSRTSVRRFLIFSFFSYVFHSHFEFVCHLGFTNNRTFFLFFFFVFVVGSNIIYYYYFSFVWLWMYQIFRATLWPLPCIIWVPYMYVCERGR